MEEQDDTKDNTLVIKNVNATIAVNKADDTIVVTYGKELAARSRRDFLGWFWVCLLWAVFMFILGLTFAVTSDLWTSVIFWALGVTFAILSRFFGRQFALFRDCLRALHKAISEEKK